MTMTITQQIITVVVVVLGTMTTRFLPFIIFPKKRLSFNQKAASQMIRQAVAGLAENKALHDELESIYLQAMDFSMMDSVLESVVAQIVDFRTAREGSLLI